jgi:hypothetical protein
MRAVLFGVLLVVGSTTAQGSEFDVAAVQWQQQEIDMDVAPIQSRADLQRHLRSGIDSPLAKLAPRAKKAFLDSLVFTPRGLGSYSYLPLVQLPMRDRYRVLALFGLQSDAARIPGSAPTSEVERHMLDVAPMIQHDWGNKICVIYSEDSMICESQYGAACSRACD